MKMTFLACLCVLAFMAPGASAEDMGHPMGGFFINGYVDGEFMAQQGNTGPGGESEWKNSFGDESEVVLWAQSDPAAKASFMTEVMYMQATNEITVQQAMINWRLHNTETYSVTTQIGKFYYPFGIESRSLHSTTNMMVSRPILQAWTDNGLAVKGGGPLGQSDASLWWDVAVTNGQTGASLSPQTTDNGNNKSFGGRVSVIPATNFEVGGSATFGKWDDEGENSYTQFGAHGIAKPYEGVDIRAEWATGTASEGYLTEDLTQTGFYGQASYTMPLEGNNMKSIGFAARFGWSDPNTDFNDDEFTQIALGMNFSPTDHFNFKLEFDMNQDSLPEDADDNAILAQGVLGW